MTIDFIKESIMTLLTDYPIQRVSLFGSRAQGTHREDSDVDLIMEFSKPVSLITLSTIRCHLEDMLGLEVDIIHGPLRADDMLDIEKEVLLYAA